MGLRDYVKRRFELIISFVAVTMAAAAVVVALYETKLMREHSRMEVRPSVWAMLNTGREADHSKFALTLANRGIGPAEIQSFTVTYEGQVVTDWVHWVYLATEGKYSLFESAEFVGRSFSSVPRSFVLQAGEEIRPVELLASKEVTDSLRAGVRKTRFSLCYCSFYKECWITRSLGAAPEAVEWCETKPDDQLVWPPRQSSIATSSED